MRLLLYIGIVCFAAACGRNTPELQNGDLLFQVGAGSDMAGAITEATGEKNAPAFTHVGIVVVRNGSKKVLEATAEGVGVTSLKDFLDRSAQIDGHPAVIAMRLRDTVGVAASTERAMRFMGQPYDYSYYPDNGRMYCSELVWESYRTPSGERVFTARPMNFRAADGTMPLFWTELFEMLSEPIPEGVLGTNPNDMSKESVLGAVYSWF